MQIAIIDCGTNTFNLLIVALNKRVYNTVFSTKIAVKLGEGGINNNKINAIPFERGIEAMEKLKKEIVKYNVEKVFAFATSAIRDAMNGEEFVNTVNAKTGIIINIIDGNKEADLIYKGNKLAVCLSTEPSLIMDIGGGSTEFIIGNNHQIFWKKSYQLGAARLLEKFNPGNPILLSEIETINLFLKDSLVELNEAINKYKPVELVGSSGAFDSIVEMIHGQLNGEPLEKLKTEYHVSCDDFFKIHQMIIQSTIEERRIMKGLIEMRVDMMVISCLLIHFCLQSYHINKFRISTYSLKEGALSEIMDNHTI